MAITRWLMDAVANSALIDRLGTVRRARKKHFSRSGLEAKEDLGDVTDLLLKRSRIALNEVYDVVCEGRIGGRIMLNQCAGALLVVEPTREVAM